MCDCCGGTFNKCPPGSQASPTSWVGSCINPDDGRAYLMRVVLGGGSGGSYFSDGDDTIDVVPDSRNLHSDLTECRMN